MDETESKAKAVRWTKLAMQPSTNAILVIGQFSEHLGPLDTATLTDHLKDGVSHVNNNNLRECEAMLYPGRRRRRVRRAHRGTLTRAAREQYCETWCACCGSNAKH
ncbi:MAG: hypothetical protein ACREXX_02560 [Gammaproteobacteria bacterium]